MNLVIDDVARPLDCLTFSELRYAKQPSEKEVDFLLLVSEGDFFSRMGAIYEDCIKELQHDDEVTGSFHPPFPGATMYPSLKELLRLPSTARMEFVDTYLVFDILRAYLQEDLSDGSAESWMVTNLISLNQSGSGISMRGRCLKV